MSLFKKLEKGVKGAFGLLSGGESRPVGELTHQKELADILGKQMASAGSADISRQEGKLAGQQALAGTTSAIRSQKGLSSGLKQRQIAGEGRKVLGQVAGSQMLAGLKERQQALRDAGSLVLGARGQGLQREGMISKADEADRARRQRTTGAVISGASSAMKGGMG